MSVLNTEWIKSYITNNLKADEKTGETILSQFYIVGHMVQQTITWVLV